MANDKRFNAKNGLSVGTSPVNVVDSDGNITANTISGNGQSITSINATSIDNGTLPATRLPASGVTAGSYGNSSQIPVVTVDTYGRVTSVVNTAVAGVSGFSYTPANSTFTITTSAGSSYDANISSIVDLTVTGNLTVSGTTTYINTQTLNVGDNIVTLNADLPGATAPTENAGIDVNRGSSANVQFLWDETNDRWSTNGQSLAVSTLFSGTISGTGPIGTTGSLDAGNTTINGFINTNSTIATSIGANAINLTNATSNWIGWNTAGVGAPTVTTRSAGTKMVLYPGISATTVDYAIGIEGSHVWFSSTSATSGFKWYSNTVNIMTANVTGLNLNTRALSGVTTAAMGNTTITGFVNATSSVAVGANSYINATAHFIGNSTVNTSITATNIGGNSAAQLGNTNIYGDLSVTGNTTLGNAGTDSVTINANTITFSANANIDAGSLYIDSLNNRIGIGNTTPLDKLSIAGSVAATGDIYTQGKVGFANSTASVAYEFYNSTTNSLDTVFG